MDRVGTPGWYFVAFSEALRRDEVRTVRLFGNHWALQRTRSGHVRLVGGRDADQPALPTIERLGNVWAWYGLDDPTPFVAVGEVDASRYTIRQGAIHHADGDYRTVLERIVSSYQGNGDERGKRVITVTGPGTAVWRVLDPDDVTGSAPLAMDVLTVTPVEPGDTLVAWRTIVRTATVTLAHPCFGLGSVGAPAR